MKLDVQQVVEATKLKTDQVRALEQGNYDSFTAPVYLRGSVRTYATLLKLDAIKLLAQLDSELSSSQKFADQLPAAARKQSSVDWLMLFLSRNWGIAAIIVVVAILALGGGAIYRAWQHRKTSDPLKDLGPGVYQPTGQSGETLPIPGSTNIKR